MDRITLTQDTIDAITRYKDSLCARSYLEFQEDCTATFYQDDSIIDVDYSLNMQWVENKESHNEVPPPNIEDLSHWECLNAEIDGIYAFDNDGNDIEITNKGMLYD